MGGPEDDWVSRYSLKSKRRSEKRHEFNRFPPYTSTPVLRLYFLMKLKSLLSFSLETSSLLVT
jgi:hypothetical protein